jgi:hypothetical protein
MITTDKIYIDQIKLLNKSIPRGQLLNMVIALAFALVMLIQSSKSVVISWLALLYFVSFVRHLLHKYYFPPAFDKPITANTGYHYALASTMAGAVWGSAIFFFKPQTLGEMLPIALTLGGVMAGGISVLSYLKESIADCNHTGNRFLYDGPANGNGSGLDDRHLYHCLPVFQPLIQ